MLIFFMDICFAPQWDFFSIFQEVSCLSLENGDNNYSSLEGLKLDIMDSWEKISEYMPHKLAKSGTYNFAKENY